MVPGRRGGRTGRRAGATTIRLAAGGRAGRAGRGKPSLYAADRADPSNAGTGNAAPADAAARAGWPADRPDHRYAFGATLRRRQLALGGRADATRAARPDWADRRSGRAARG